MPERFSRHTVLVLILAALLSSCRDSRPDRGLGVQIKGEGCEVIRVPDFWLPPVWVQDRHHTRDPIWVARRGLEGVAWRARAADVKQVDELLLAAQFNKDSDFGPPEAAAPQEFVYSTNKYAFRLCRKGARRMIAPAPYRTVSDQEWNAAAPIACNGCGPNLSYEYPHPSGGGGIHVCTATKKSLLCLSRASASRLARLPGITGG
jgi:hypothetical protein